MNRYFIMLFSVLCLAMFTARAQEEGAYDETEDEREEQTGEGPRILLNKYTLGNGLRFSTNGGNLLIISGMVQSTFESRKFDDVDDFYNRFRMRRARVRFDGRLLGDKVRYRLGLDLVKGSETDGESGSMLMDAWIAYRPWGNKLVITAGQMGTPTDNLELSMSSHTLQFVERSKITSMFSTIRELGINLSGSYRVGPYGLIRPQVAITDGNGPVTAGKRYGGLKYGARVNYLPFGAFRSMGGNYEGDMAYEITPKLSLGVAYSYADGVSDRRGGRSTGDMLYKDADDRIALPDYAKLVADIHFKYRGFSFLGEFAKTWAYVPSSITQRVRNDGTTATTFEVDGRQDVEAYIKNRLMLGSGFNLQAGYMLRSRWSFDVRYTHIMPDKYSFMHNDLYFNRDNFYDLGISKYLTRNYSTKIQLTLGMAQTAGVTRTPDGNHTFDGHEFTGQLMFQIKF